MHILVLSVNRFYSIYTKVFATLVMVFSKRQKRMRAKASLLTPLDATIVMKNLS